MVKWDQLQYCMYFVGQQLAICQKLNSIIETDLSPNYTEMLLLCFYIVWHTVTCCDILWHILTNCDILRHTVPLYLRISLCHTLYSLCCNELVFPSRLESTFATACKPFREAVPSITLCIFTIIWFLDESMLTEKPLTAEVDGEIRCSLELPSDASLCMSWFVVGK